MAKTLGRKIWQHRKVDEPWCIWVIATKDRNKCTCDAEIYAEWIPCRAKCFKLKGINIARSASQLCQAVGKVCSAYGHRLEQEDYDLIIKEIEELKDGFKHC